MSNEQLLDLVFVLDATGSMGPYIRSAENSINNIVKQIHDSKKLASPSALRVGVLAYRDVEGFVDFLTKPCPLTSDIGKVQTFLKHLGATGGGDGPEAVATALDVTINDANVMGWLPPSKGAHQIIVHITDAPPHGIEPGDPKRPVKDASTAGIFADNILNTNKILKNNGFTYFVVSCGEMGKLYQLAVPFYRRATSGNGYMLPLVRADLLPNAITAFALESLALDTALEEMRDELKSLSLGEKPSFANDDTFPKSMPRFDVLLHAVVAPEVVEKKELTSEELNHIMDMAETPEDLDIMTKAFRPPPEHAVDMLHTLFKAKGTKVPVLKSNLTYDFTGNALHNWKVMENAKTPEDLTGTLPTPEGIPLSGSGAQAMEVVHEPVTKDQVERMAQRFRKKYGAPEY